MEDFTISQRTEDDYEYRNDNDEDYMNEGQISQSDDKELIYNENIGYNNIDKLFDDKSEETEVFEIEFKIYDKSKKNMRFIKIDLEKISYRKPYLGGYIHKKNGSYYLHSYCQTDQYKNQHKIKNEREVQTQIQQTRSTKMQREFGTQMEYIGVYIDSTNDKIITPKKYFDSNDWEARLFSTVLYMQKRSRGFLAKKEAAMFRKDRDDRERAKEIKEEEEKLKEELKNKKEIERRMHPKTPNDFILLRKELDAWVKSETARIKSSNLNDEDKNIALQELLHKEISLLQTIEKLKISANKENRTETIQEFLKKMSADKIWQLSDGHSIKVATVLTKTAEKLEEQFKNLNSSTSVDIRLKNLLEFKRLMESYYEEHRCTLIQEIISLIERESDMLGRGRPESSLEGLRQRLNNLYLNFIETPLFNPEAARFQIIPKDYLMDLYKAKKSEG